MDKLRVGIKQPFAVLPQPSVLVQLGKAAIDHPALGNHRKLVQLTALGNLHRDVLAQCLAHPLRQRLFQLAAVTQHALHLPQVSLVLSRWLHVS